MSSREGRFMPSPHAQANKTLASVALSLLGRLGLRRAGVLWQLLAAHDGEVQADLHGDGLAVYGHDHLAVDVPAQAACAELLDHCGLWYTVDLHGKVNS